MKEWDEASQGYQKESKAGNEYITNQEHKTFSKQSLLFAQRVLICFPPCPIYTTKVQILKGLSVLDILNFDTETELMESNIQEGCQMENIKLVLV